MFILIVQVMLILSCNHYKDFDFKKKLSDDFYLAQSNILPSKYVCIERKNHFLIIIDDIISVKGNKSYVVLKTLESKKTKYYKIIFDKVEYPEDVLTLNPKQYDSIMKGAKFEYMYNETKGFRMLPAPHLLLE